MKQELKDKEVSLFSYLSKYRRFYDNYHLNCLYIAL
nr:MAG TPA: hypothetical protein [Caudoviricetes sp.]